MERARGEITALRNLAKAARAMGAALTRDFSAVPRPCPPISPGRATAIEIRMSLPVRPQSARGRYSPPQVRPHFRPISSTSFLMANRSREATGRERRSPILRSRIVNASRNVRSISRGEPCTPAGSATPQCAVTGWPGQIGQTSFAALSQTVNTKSILGASGKANSSQDLLRRPSTGICAACKRCKASGRTLPDG